MSICSNSSPQLTFAAHHSVAISLLEADWAFNFPPLKLIDMPSAVSAVVAIKQYSFTQLIEWSGGLMGSKYKDIVCPVYL